MARKYQNIEFEETREEKTKSFTLRSLMDGNVLTQRSVIRQAPFLALIVVLSLLMIANRNHAEKLVIRTNQLHEEVKEMRSKAISTSSDLVKMSRQSNVEQLIRDKELGLVENKEPLKKLEKEEN